jgi:DNA-binding HxlR family transcriptional regulator
MLTLTLRGLERDGLVTRTVFPTIPPRVDYELTELGRTLISTLKGLAEWANENSAAVQKAQRNFDAKANAEAKSKSGSIRRLPTLWRGGEV